MKTLCSIVIAGMLLTGCSKTLFDEGDAALVIYEPTAGDVRTLKEDLKPHVKLYSDYVVITYTRTKEDQKTENFVHVVPKNRFGLVRWLDPNKR